MQAARAAYAAAPDQPRPLFTLAALLLRHADPDAVALLPALERHQDFVGGWLAIGDALLACGRHDAALAAIERALRGPGIASAPAYARAHHLHGQALAAAGRSAEAAQAFARGTEADPLHAEGWYSLALLQQDRGENEDAVASYRAALRARPDFHEAALNLGVASGECGRIDAALDAYGHALALRPALFGRIAQALTSGRTGLVVLDPARLKARLLQRASPF